MVMILLFFCPWYSVPKGGEITQSKLIKAAGMTTCLAHRPRKNSYAVGLRCIAAQNYGKPLKKKSPSLVSLETPLIFRPKSAKNSPADELIAPSVSNAIGWNMYAAGRLQCLVIFLVAANSAVASADLADALI